MGSLLSCVEDERSTAPNRVDIDQKGEVETLLIVQIRAARVAAIYKASVNCPILP